MKKIKIQLEDLVCPMCASKIEAALKKLKGVNDVIVSYNSSKATVSFNEEEINIEEIVKTINNAGYDVISYK